MVLTTIDPARLPTLGSNDVHLALYLLWLLPEVLPTPPGGKTVDTVAGLAPLMSAVLASSAVQIVHPGVTTQIFDLCSRFRACFFADPGLLSSVLPIYLGAPGLGHSLPAMRARAGVAFLVLVRHLSRTLLPFAPALLAALLPALRLDVAGRGAAEARASASGRTASNNLSSSSSSSSSSMLSFSDQLCLYEAAALVAAAAGDASSCCSVIEPLAAHLAETAGTLTAALHGSAGNETRAMPLGVARARTQAVSLLVHIMDCYVALGKAFPNVDAMSASGTLPVFLRALELCTPLATLPHASSVSPLRNGFRALLHRLLRTLTRESLSVLDAPLAALAAPVPLDEPAPDLAATLAVLGQIASAHKTAVVPLVAARFPALAASVFAVLEQPADSRDATAVASHHNVSLRERWRGSFVVGRVCLTTTSTTTTTQKNIRRVVVERPAPVGTMFLG